MSSSPTAGSFADRRLMLRAGFALLLANIRYWPTVAPHVRSQLAHWERRAQAIPDERLRGLAAGKLAEERFNSEVAATLATLAPRAHRGPAVEAIVALQVMYDYLDVLSEQSHLGEQLFEPFIEALAPAGALPEKDALRAERLQDGGYLQELLATVRSAIALLPARSLIAEPAQRAAGRCAQAQARGHGAAQATGADPALELARWAKLQARGTGLEWREYLAGASASVLAVHALIAAAADPDTTGWQAVSLDALYLSIGALTMLDSLIDYQADIDASRPGYVQHYDHDRDLLAQRLALLARNAADQARVLPNGAHHIVTLVGIVAYYGSAPGAESKVSRPVFAHVNRELRPLIAPTLALMRAWRTAKRLRG